MIKTFLFAAVLFLTAPARTNAAGPADPDKPLPEAKQKITLPSSPRTKGNLADVALDFMLTRTLGRIKNVRFEYKFLEIQDKIKVKLSDVSVKIDSPRNQGEFFFKTLFINPTELISGIKDKHLHLSQIRIEGLSSAFLIVKSGKEIVLKTDSVDIEGVDFADWNKENKATFVFKSIALGKGSYTRDEKRLQWKTFGANNVRVILSPPAHVLADKITYNGQVFDSPESFRKQIWEPVLFK